MWIQFRDNEMTGKFLTHIETGEVRNIDLNGQLWVRNPRNGQYELVIPPAPPQVDKGEA